jgi:hypothetical protein
MGRSAADKRRQDWREDGISRIAASLGLPPELLAVDRLMLSQIVDLFDWHPRDLEQTMRRADTVRRLVENVEHRHGGNGTAPRMPRQAPETAAQGDGAAGRLPDSDAHLVAAGDSP